MKTFKQFLSEEAISFDQVCMDIKQKCSYFLENSNELPLYRGIRTHKITPTFTPHPVERRALNSPDYLVEFFNAMIEASYGISKIRSSTLFATGNKIQSQNYGTPTFCFPAGQLEYLWSNKIHDSYENEEKFFDTVAKYLSRYYSDDSGFLENDGGAFIMCEIMFKHLSSHGFSKLLQNISNPQFHKQLINAFYSNISYASSIRAFFESNKITETTENFEKFLENFVSVLGKVGKDLYKNTSLADAIGSYNEILFYNTDGYYSLPIDYVQDQLTTIYPDMLPGIKEQYKQLLTHLQNI